jgi:class 3 adenylate cyclase/predicted ATPase
MDCAACGTANRPGSRFCDNCGSTLESRCSTCGETNRSDARFCASCGAALGTDAPWAAPPASTPTPARPTEAAGAERRLVTVLFTDLVGFTTLAEDRDPESVRELLSSYFETATEVVRLHGGTVEKFIGDAVMAVWGTPVAHEDDAERAVRAGLEIVDAVSALLPGLQARAGVLTGEAAVTLGATNQGMVAGDLVNTAARLQGVAEAGTVLVGEGTRRAAERAIVFEAIGEHSLKGKTSPVPAWRAVRVVAARGGQGRGDALEPPFVGRDEELRQLKEALHTVGRERRPRLVSISGPGGIGKSRLAWELEKYVDGVSEDVWWHRGRSPSYGEGITFWALGEMVRRRAQLTEDADDATTRERIAGTLTEYVSDPEERERIGPALLALLGLEPAPPGGRDALFPAWRSFFERIAERGTTVLVFEDLQWADTGLLDFIDHLLEWSRGLPIMVVTLARPELFDRRPDWGANRRNLTSLALEPLDDASIRALLDGLVPGLPEDALAAIVGRAEGMPLYAVETVRGLLADGLIERRDDVYVPVGDLSTLRVPESLRSLIASRLDALDPSDRTLLQDASVLGQVFGPAGLAAISGLETAQVEERLRALARRELVDLERDPASPERGQYKFVQALIREVAYGTLARRDRRARHLAVARHFEASGDEELAGALASHYVAAHAASDDGAEAEAVATQARLALSAAAERAASLGAHEQAIAYLEQALTVAIEPRDRAALLTRAARSAVAASRDAEHFATAAIEVYRELGDRPAVVLATARLGQSLIDKSDVNRAIELLEGSLPEAEATGDEPALAETFAYLARAYMRVGDGEKAVAAADRALPIAERLNLDHVAAEGFVNKGSGYSLLGRRREAVALQAMALEIVERIGDRTLEMRIRNNYASAVAADDPARATRILLEAADLASETGDRSMYTWLIGTAGALIIDQGEGWDAHMARMRDALEATMVPSDRLRLVVLLGLFETARGERIDELAAEVRALVGENAEPDATFSLGMTMTETALVRGELDEAFRQAWDLAGQPSQNPDVPLLSALRAASLAGDRERARMVADRMDAVTDTGPWGQFLRLHAAGSVAALEGRVAEAVTDFAAAREIVQRLRLLFADAWLVVIAARLLPAEREVRSWADEVRPLLVELRAAPWIAVLDEALASAGAPVPPGSPAAVATESARAPRPG